MARKVIIDCDPGIDDAVALCIALFDPRLEVLALTAVEGVVPSDQATRNVQAITDQLDPPRLPRIGAAGAVDDAPAIDGTTLNGRDGLGNAGLATAQLHHRHPSDKIICDEARAAPDEISIICLGPLTNVARALKRDPELTNVISRIVIAGGSVSVGGNVTPAAEMNFYCDPISARTVLRSATTKTLVPLDVTRQVKLTLDMLDELPDEESRVGSLLRRMLPFAFRAHHQELGQERILLHGVVTLISVLHPELFESEEMAGDVEIRGNLAMGASVFDRRIKPLWLPNMEVTTSIDAAAVADCIVRGLNAAGDRTRS